MSRKTNQESFDVDTGAHLSVGEGIKWHNAVQVEFSNMKIMQKRADFFAYIH